jgi:hypothetical protein
LTSNSEVNSPQLRVRPPGAGLQAGRDEFASLSDASSSRTPRSIASRAPRRDRPRTGATECRSSRQLRARATCRRGLRALSDDLASPCDANSSRTLRPSATRVTAEHPRTTANLRAPPVSAAVDVGQRSGRAVGQASLTPETMTSRPAGRLVRRNRRRPTLPGPCEPSTIGAVGLNCSVRNGKRCFPHAIATGNCARPGGPSKLHSFSRNGISIRQALDPLVPVSYVCRHTSRSGLSTWWSTRGLTPSRGWESSSRGRLPA